jgi:SulP family sulfate permease
MTDGSATSHLFRPKLLTTLREGYHAPDFRRDALAGATVAIVALPLSMAIAVASGVSPERGLYAAIIGGALVSVLGGSRFQIGGPAGAFIVLVASTVGQFGVQGLLLTVLLSGFMLTLLGVVRIGALVRHIPHAVTVGFSCGIAVTIFASQIKDLAGLKLAAEPGQLVAKVLALWSAAGTFTWSALIVGLGTTAGIFVLRHFLPHWPGMLIAVTLASAAAAGWDLPVETIADRFGALPRGLPSPALPDMSWDLLWTVMPGVLSFTLLGGVESLLSAKIADTMTGRKHRSNMELVAQGIANIGSAIFGGISVTGTIARTATNIRAGARSPFAGIMHAGFLLVFLVFAAPAAGYVPLATLAGLLVVVCWNMAEKQEFGRLIRRRNDALVLLTTFGLTLLEDLTVGIVAGCIVAAVLALPFGRSSGAQAIGNERE